jgi:hypothetical protein
MSVEDAVRESLKAFASVFGEAAQTDLRLEEVALSEDESLWVTTVSYPNPDLTDVTVSPPAPNSLAALFSSATPKRLYKVIRLRADDGRFLGIKNAA